MQKIKAFFHKINKNLILYSIILITILIISHVILKLFNLRFRQWVYLSVIGISAIGILIRIIQKFMKQRKKKKYNNSRNDFRHCPESFFYKHIFTKYGNCDNISILFEVDNSAIHTL